YNFTFYDVIFKGQPGIISSSGQSFHSVLFEKDGEIRGSNTFENLAFSPGKTYILSAGSTQTITPLGNFIAEGFGGFPIEIKSSQLGTQATLHKDGDPICLDFLYLTDLAATGTGFTYAGANSDDVFNNSGWIFEACPPCFYAPPPPAPTLDPASITSVSVGDQAKLILANLPVGYEAEWFDSDQQNEFYASTENNFMPFISQTTVFYGAIREIATGCVSELLEVTVSICLPPNINAFSNAPFCAGTGDLLLQENGGAAIDWSWTGPNGFASADQNPVIFSPDASALGNYTVVVTGANGCTNAQGVAVAVYDDSDILGNIIRSDCNNVPVEGASVSLTGGAVLNDQSDAAGNFEFISLSCGNAYTVTPKKTGNDADGVTVRDLVLISRHILGLEPLNSPYKMIAADANKSGSITTFDIVELRKLILGNYTALPNNDAWRFVPKDFAFQNPNNPFQGGFPESDLIDPLLDNEQSDFYGIKVGDLDGCSATNGAATVKFLAADASVSECGSWVDITVEDFDNVAGFQFSLNWDATQIAFLEWGDANPALNMDASHFGIAQTASGKLTLAWTNGNFPLTGQSLPNGAVLFRIKLKAIGSAGTGLLAFSDSPTPRQVLDGNMQPHAMLQKDGALTFGVAPIALCQDITVNLNPGECSAALVPTDIDAGSNDGCGIASLSIQPSVAYIGTNTVTLTVTDNSGLVGTCAATVTVLEFPNPVVSLMCHDNITVSLGDACADCIGADQILEGGPYGCLEGYMVEMDRTLPLGNGPWMPACVSASDIGKTYQLRVTDPDTGNKCWGNVKVQDELPPVVSCQSFSIPCNTPNVSPGYLSGVLGIVAANPGIVDCQDFTATFVDTNVPQPCGSGLTNIIQRDWTVTDISGNIAQCQQIIGQTRPTLADVALPPHFDGTDKPAFSCASAAYPSPEWIKGQGFQGFPLVFGQPSGCSDIFWSYNDLLITICDGTRRVLRQWSIVDFCTGEVLSFNQRIKVEDAQGPTMVCPSNTSVTVDPFSCCSTTELPNMIVDDGCSRINNVGVTVTTFDPQGHQSGVYRFDGTLQNFPGNNLQDRDTLATFALTPCLPIGDHTVTYIAEDDCQNTGSCSFTLSVRDFTPPVAICQEFTSVALGVDNPDDCYTGAVSWVSATSFNDGSYDHCYNVKFTVRRLAPYSGCINSLGHYPCSPNSQIEYDLATAEQDSIKFYCCEVGTTQSIVLAVYQIDSVGLVMFDPNGFPIKNECVIEVEVKDKMKPTCAAPAHISVSCENFDPSLFAYNFATATDNCCVDAAPSVTDNYALFDDLCNKGTITRTFKALDCSGNSRTCTQRIVVNYEQNYFVKFPDDVFATECAGNFGEPTFFGVDCELLGVSYEDEVIDVVPDACFKIFRTWTIINWCTYNPNFGCTEVPNPNPNNNPNHASNRPGPIVSACGTLGPWASTVVKILPSDPFPGTDFCTFWDANANCYKYTQVIKVIDGEKPVINCPASSPHICDATANDPELWNETYWLDPQSGSNDLKEVAVDLSHDVTDLCSGSNVSVRYLLFLDLDNDGTFETVVNSDNLPAHGTVNFGNAQNPNYSGGTPRVFDERPVPGNEKYGFALQTIVVGEHKIARVLWNTEQSPNGYYLPQLPYGTHKIKWFATDACGNDATCEYLLVVPWAGCACVPTYTNQTFCPGETVSPISLAGFPAYMPYTWTNDNPAIGLPASGSGDLPEFRALNYCPTPMVATIRVYGDYQSLGLSCPNPAPVSFTITVNPGQVVFNPGDQMLCHDGSSMEIDFMGSFPDMMFSWTNDNPAIGLAADGTGDIPSFTAINGGSNATVTANIQVVGFGINGLLCPDPVPANFSITVNPTPVMDTPPDQSLCGGQYTSVVPFSSSILSSYTWTNDNPNIGLAASGSGNLPPFLTTNNTGAPITATITVTPKGGDSKAPTVVCTNGLSVNLLPAQAGGAHIFLYASDFLQYVEDNVTPNNLIKISIRKSGAGSGFPVDQFGNPITTVMFDCSAIGTQYVEVWAQDECGNADYCESYVSVQDYAGHCMNTGDRGIAGQVMTEDGYGVEEAVVYITGPGVSRFDLTDENGNYSFNDLLPDGQSYQVCVEKNDNPLNGVTTYDLVLISKHILGEELLDSPYKIIAADADRSGVVDPTDIEEIRNLILGIYTDLPNNTSWRFIPADYVFPDPANPLIYNFPHGCKTVTVDGSDVVDGDFIGVKIGDVNATAVANGRPSDPPGVNRGLPPSSACDGCEGAPVTFTITIQPQPAIIASVNDPLCQGSDMFLKETGGEAINWKWEGPKNFYSAIQNPIIGYLQSDRTGTYQLIVTGSNGCTNIDFVEVALQQSPVLSNCPAGIVVSSDIDKCDKIVVFPHPIATSPCFDVSLTMAGIPPGGIFPLGVTVQTYTATDAAGNQASCSFTVTVVDTQGPTARCKDFVRELGADGNGYISVSDLDDGSTDNCSVSLDYGIEYGFVNCNNLGENIATLTVTDASGNAALCTGTITVIDNLKPTFDNCPLDMTVSSSLDKCGAYLTFLNPTASDNCSIVAVAQTAGMAPGGFFPVGTTVQTYIATDGSGNTEACQFNVTVMDMQLPTAVCQDYVLDLDISGNGSITTANINGGSTDNCPGVLVYALSKSTFNCLNIGENNVALTVTDGANNTATCVAEVTVRDVTAPIIAYCPASVTVDDCDDVVPDLIPGLGFQDACSLVGDGTQNPVAGSAFGQVSGNSVTVTFTVSDGSGNTQTCTATVTILDNVKPTFDNCPASISLGNDVDKCGANVTFLNPTASDNCSAVTVNPAAGN
ncbi:MAG: HYR domain-containing protein, partial [Saprospiraceae bacterium]